MAGVSLHREGRYPSQFSSREMGVVSEIEEPDIIA